MVENRIDGASVPISNSDDANGKLLKCANRKNSQYVCKVEPIVRQEPWRIPKRHVITVLTFVGLSCLYIMRSNLSIAMVEMTSDKNISRGNETVLKEKEFNWDSKEKGHIISLFSYGYLIACPFGGILATKYGGCTVFGIGTAVTALLTAISPILIRKSLTLFAIARIMEGIFEGVANPAWLSIFIHWAPPNELSRMVITAGIGISAGAAINFPVSGFIAHNWGWESVFYVTGGVSLLWSLIWFLLVKNYPHEDKYLSIGERQYLQQTVRNVSNIASNDIMSYPWRKILTSKPAWALINQYFSSSWQFSFVLFCLPLYVKDVNPGDTAETGMISGIPLFATILGQLSSAFLADYLRSRKIMTVSNVHRSFIFIGQMGSILPLIVTGIWADFTTSIVMFSLMRIFFGYADTSYQVIPIDVFSQYAGVIKGLCLTAYGAVNIVNPIVAGYMVTHHSKDEWNKYFIFLSLFHVWSLIIYFLCGSGEPQSWVVETVRHDGQTDDEKSSSNTYENSKSINTNI